MLKLLGTIPTSLSLVSQAKLESEDWKKDGGCCDREFNLHFYKRNSNCAGVAE